MGLGCNRIGQAHEADGHWIDLLEAARSAGVTLLDTSEVYADTQSERLIGDVLGSDPAVVIASKIGAFEPRHLERETALRALDGSLKRLRRDCLDVLQLHSPGRAALAETDWPELLEDLQQRGLIRLRGVAIDTTADAVRLLKACPDAFDLLQVTYHLGDRSAEAELFPLAQQHGIALLGRMPLARGIFTGKFRQPEEITESFRGHLMKERTAGYLDVAHRLEPVAEAYPGGITRLAHHFAMAPAAITATIPGAKNRAQLSANLTAADGPDDDWPAWRERIQQVLDAG